MDVVYLFYENKNIRIPFYNYDKNLFSKLIKTRIGDWDPVRSQFIVKSEYGDTLISQVLANRPYMEVEKSPETPIIVGGFLNQNPTLCLLDDDTDAPAHIMDDIPCIEHHPLPDMFSQSWQVKLEAELQARKYSPNTLASYSYYNRDLCRCLQKPPEEITAVDVKNYLAYQNKTKNLSASTMNLALSAFKFFYTTVLKRDIVEEQRRPRQDKRLPVVLSKAEVKAVFDAEKNIKHRLLLMMAYSSGLRVSEVVSLRRSDIDPARKTVLVSSGKGRKDRYTLLSDQVIRILKEYYFLHDIKTWLFTGQSTAQHLSIRSAQKIFENALQKANVKKGASIHSLRHTFATHLLENGTDVRYIQELLGHRSIRTTERYTHVARRATLKIQSPLDTIEQKD
ncbi:tyrosine-type recombinase/integrase [Treponema primitia]|uniref:tyrosine-type recombinase/integrase n=1 Tax=Treponema primitia TaxID=88058 RepID=UPI00025556C7|nr:site-specific integrase [Treponema primitia]